MGKTMFYQFFLWLTFSATAHATGSAISGFPFQPNRMRSFNVAFGGATEGTASCAAATCTIYRQSDDEGNTNTVSSVSRSATGTYSINVTAGRCSVAPTCTFVLSGIVANLLAMNGAPSTSSVPIKIYSMAASLINGVLSATLIDGSGYVTCMCLK